MRKSLILASALLMLGGMASCSDDDKAPEAVETTTGFYTINGGNKKSKVPASITAYDYATGRETQDAFYAKNQVRIGDGAQKAIIYGSKMYIAMYTSNVIWVVEPETLGIIKSIQPTGEATLPRALAAKNGKVYVSMYTGYVACVDTASLTIEKNIKVGPNPDQIAIAGDDLIVANSDGQNSKGGASDGVKYGNSSISIVNLSAWTQTEIKDIDRVLNPTDAASNGEEAFVICKGNYEDQPSVVKKVVGNDVKEVCKGTLIACQGDELYVINAPYSKTATPDKYTYQVYSTKDLKLKKEKFLQMSPDNDSWILSPNCVAVDPVSRDIIVLSYVLDGSGTAQYALPMYGNIYDKDGAFKKRFECGAGGRAITFIPKRMNQ